MIETRRTCVIAMSHITEATAAMLFRTPLGQWPVMGAPMGCDALMIYAHTETHDDVPADLRDVITWARAQMPPGATAEGPGFEYVLLDNDAPPVAGLHDYCAHERAAPPPGPWKRAPGEFWAAEYGSLRDHGGQRCIRITDAHPIAPSPVAFVVCDEGDDEAAAAVDLIEAAPETAAKLARIVKGAAKIEAEAKAYDEKMCGGPDGEGESRPPNGDDYNEMWGWLTQLTGLIAEAGKAS